MLRGSFGVGGHDRHAAAAVAPFPGVRRSPDVVGRATLRDAGPAAFAATLADAARTVTGPRLDLRARYSPELRVPRSGLPTAVGAPDGGRGSRRPRALRLEGRDDGRGWAGPGRSPWRSSRQGRPIDSGRTPLGGPSGWPGRSQRDLGAAQPSSRPSHLDPSSRPDPRGDVTGSTLRWSWPGLRRCRAVQPCCESDRPGPASADQRYQRCCESSHLGPGLARRSANVRATTRPNGGWPGGERWAMRTTRAAAGWQDAGVDAGGCDGEADDHG